MVTRQSGAGHTGLPAKSPAGDLQNVPERTNGIFPGFPFLYYTFF